MRDPRRLYKELGNLFYAIAAADNNISEAERKKLDDEVQYCWKHFEKSIDRFGSDRAFLIEFEFESMEDISETAENAYQLFETYFKENESAFDVQTKEQIFISARHIAESVRKINQSELAYLMRLKELLNV